MASCRIVFLACLFPILLDVFVLVRGIQPFAGPVASSFFRPATRAAHIVLFLVLAGARGAEGGGGGAGPAAGGKS